MEEKNIESTLIILKNSTKENAIPTPENLEVGEIALSLFPGQEAIWVKNSKGEVLDIRKPSSESLWNNIFEVFSTRTEFETALEEGKINQNNIYFIALEKQIWVKGEFYASDYDPAELDRLVSQRLIIVPQGVYNIDPENYSSDDIQEAWGGKEKFREIAVAAGKGNVLAAINVGSGSLPVGISAKITSADRIEIVLEWIWSGEYKHITYSLKYDIFGIENFSSTPVGGKVTEDIEKINAELKEVNDNLCWIEEEG